MKRLKPEDKARLELEFMQESKDLDKYDYDTRMKFFIALIAALIPFLLKTADLLSQKLPVPGILLSLTLVLAVTVGVWPWIALYPITKGFRKKRKMGRSRWKTLGIDPIKLDKEFRETKLP